MVIIVAGSHHLKLRPDTHYLGQGCAIFSMFLYTKDRLAQFMPNKSTDTQEKFRLLQQQYAAKLPEKIAALERAWQAVNENPADTPEYQNLLRGLHTLAGSGGSYGFAVITSLCREIEAALKSSPPPLTTALKQEIENKLTALKRAASRQPAHFDQTEHRQNAPLTNNEVNGKRLVFFHDEDASLTKMTLSQLKHYDYDITPFCSLLQLKELLGKHRPTAIVYDISLPNDAELDTLAQLTVRDNNKIPTLVISKHSETEHRLRAVRAGADAFFTKPLDHHYFIDTLDELTSKHVDEPHRILIVDDSESAASYYANSLQQAGMETHVVANPLDIMRYIVEFNPELILMDLYMPTCHGIELATVIRQQESYVGTPIVFLSSETDLNQQMSAMQHGGDDFLTKPISADHLVSAVQTRANRYRKLRSHMSRDSLTGLYNHTNIKELLNQELARAMRTDTPLSFVMLDIDHFKTINDNYGHATGDRVIKTLARMLVKRLRKIDLVGRYGGEEFAVILPDTELKAAKRVIDELRQNFENLPFDYENQTFMITFSAGIAAYPDSNNFNILMDRADQALYRAKQQGRNLVVMAD